MVSYIIDIMVGEEKNPYDEAFERILNTKFEAPGIPLFCAWPPGPDDSQECKAMYEILKDVWGDKEEEKKKKEKNIFKHLRRLIRLIKQGKSF